MHALSLEMPHPRPYPRLKPCLDFITILEMLTATLFKSMMELIMTNAQSSNTLGNNTNIQSLHHDVQFLVLKGNLLVLVIVNFKF